MLVHGIVVATFLPRYFVFIFAILMRRQLTAIFINHAWWTQVAGQLWQDNQTRWRHTKWYSTIV
jgi:hypothetical protein